MILELMRSRRSVRRFKAEAPSKAALEKLLEAAVSAPSASNKQPWRFLVVRDRAVIERMAAAVSEATARVAAHVEPAARAQFEAYGDYFTRFRDAPVVIVVLHRSLTLLSNLLDAGAGAEDRAQVARMEETSGLIGASMALQNLLLMAHAEGLGASGMTGPLIADKALRELLSVPDSWAIAALAPVGFPDEAPRPVPRKPLDAVVRWID
jgi:nitroreductase